MLSERMQRFLEKHTDREQRDIRSRYRNSPQNNNPASQDDNTDGKKHFRIFMKQLGRTLAISALIIVCSVGLVFYRQAVYGRRPDLSVTSRKVDSSSVEYSYVSDINSGEYSLPEEDNTPSNLPGLKREKEREESQTGEYRPMDSVDLQNPMLNENVGDLTPVKKRKKGKHYKPGSQPRTHVTKRGNKKKVKQVKKKQPKNKWKTNKKERKITSKYKMTDEATDPSPPYGRGSVL